MATISNPNANSKHNIGHETRHHGSDTIVTTLVLRLLRIVATLREDSGIELPRPLVCLVGSLSAGRAMRKLNCLHNSKNLSCSSCV